MTPGQPRFPQERIIEVNKGDDVRLTIPGDVRSCVYIGLAPNGLLTITGGASIIDSIEGKGIQEKVIPEEPEPHTPSTTEAPEQILDDFAKWVNAKVSDGWIILRLVENYKKEKFQ
jgi:hypothetical protein